MVSLQDRWAQDDDYFDEVDVGGVMWPFTYITDDDGTALVTNENELLQYFAQNRRFVGDIEEKELQFVKSLKASEWNNMPEQLKSELSDTLEDDFHYYGT